jgi:hypothetical protein
MNRKVRILSLSRDLGVWGFGDTMNDREICILKYKEQLEAHGILLTKNKKVKIVQNG